MTTTQKRNSAFVRLIRETKNISFGTKILVLSAFASGAGCVFKYDSTYFELWSNSSPSARLVYRVTLGVY